MKVDFKISMHVSPSNAKTQAQATTCHQIMLSLLYLLPIEFFSLKSFILNIEVS